MSLFSPGNRQNKYLNRQGDLLSLGRYIHFRHTFTKKLSHELIVWCNSGADASNIAAGFDPYFQSLSDSSNNGSTTLSVEGITLTTAATADADDLVIEPTAIAATHLLRTSGILSLSNGYDIEVTWAIKTGSNIADCTIFAGAGENIKSAIGGTSGDDQAGFVKREGDVNWQFVIVKANSATYFDTKIPVVASTSYILSAKFRASDGKVELKIAKGDNSPLTTVGRTTDTYEFTAATNLYPFAWVENTSGAGAAKSFTARGVDVFVDRTS